MRGTKQEDRTQQKTVEQDRVTHFPQFPMSSSRSLKIFVMVPIYLCRTSLWDMWYRIHKVFGDLPLDTFLCVHRIWSILDFYTIWKMAFDPNVLHLASAEALQGCCPQQPRFAAWAHRQNWVWGCLHAGKSRLLPPTMNAGFVRLIHELNLHVQIRKTLGMQDASEDKLM